MRISLMGFLIGQCLLFSQSMGQVQTPQLLAPGVISNDRVFGITLSPDGQTAYFVNSRGGRDTMTLAYSTRRKGQWSKPQPVIFANQPGIWKDIDPVLSPDGTLLLFNSTRPRPEAPTQKDFDIWTVRQTAKKGWGEPYNLGNVVNSDSADFYASMASNGNLYFSSTRKGGYGSVDIYVSKYQNGTYQTPVNLGQSVNTAGSESNSFIAPDESYLLFFALDSTGSGDSDLMISFRKNNHWTTTQNLGPAINSELGEFTPFVSNDGKTLYFSRLKRGKPLVENIYAVPFNSEIYRQKATIRTTTESDTDNLKACLMDYLMGGTQGDTIRLMRAFHPSASMKFIDNKTGEFKDVPIADYLDGARKNYGRYTARTTRIIRYEISGTAAQARVESDYPTFKFIDHFNLLKTTDGWKIVSKIFYREEKN